MKQKNVKVKMENAMKKKDATHVFVELEKELPAVIPRNRINDYLPGLYSVGHWSNMTSNGRGPRVVSISGRICFLKKDLLKWLHKRTVVIQKRINKAR